MIRHAETHSLRLTPAVLTHVQYRDMVKGTGATPPVGFQVVVDYVAYTDQVSFRLLFQIGRIKIACPCCVCTEWALKFSLFASPVNGHAHHLLEIKLPLHNLIHLLTTNNTLPLNTHTAQGRVFDSSAEKGKPYDIRVGSGQVIPGLDEGLRTMQ